MTSSRSSRSWALYIGAISSSSFRVFIYVFLRLVSFSCFRDICSDTDSPFRSPLDGVNTSSPGSTWLTLQPFLSPLALYHQQRKRKSDPTLTRLRMTCHLPVQQKYASLTDSTHNPDHLEVFQQQPRHHLGTDILTSYHSPHIGLDLVHQHASNPSGCRLCFHPCLRFRHRRHIYTRRCSLPRRGQGRSSLPPLRSWCHGTPCARSMASRYRHLG
jgi:hypothetical protein